jgi:hypothetical protein
MNETFWHKHKYKLLLGTYFIIAAGAIFRVLKQPYTKSMKVSQIQRICRGTTIAAVLAAIGIGAGSSRARSGDEA